MLFALRHFCITTSEICIQREFKKYVWENFRLAKNKIKHEKFIRIQDNNNTVFWNSDLNKHWTPKQFVEPPIV